jgi:5-methylcytosine-specific restriction enzyme A
MNSRPAGRPRLYDARWRRESREFLKVHRLCAYCIVRGQRVPSTIVDHKTPHRGDLVLFWDKAGNWAALCRTCHNAAKQREEKLGRTIGCDADGRPLDRGHHWNRAATGPRGVSK